MQAEYLRAAGAGGGFLRFFGGWDDMLTDPLDLCLVEFDFLVVQKGAQSVKKECANTNTHIQNITFEQIKN